MCLFEDPKLSVTHTHTHSRTNIIVYMRISILYYNKWPIGQVKMIGVTVSVVSVKSTVTKVVTCYVTHIDYNKKSKLSIARNYRVIRVNSSNAITRSDATTR